MPYGGNIHGAVGADLVQADVDAIVQGLAGSPGKTLADVQAPLAGVLECLLGNQSGALTDIGGRLGDGLFDAATSSPLLQVLGESLRGYLVDPVSSVSWMEQLQYRLDAFLLDTSGYQPWLQTIHGSLGGLFETYLNDGMNGRPWMATLAQDITDGFYNHLYDQNAYQPWFQTIKQTLDSCLYDAVNARPWMETLDGRLASLLAILNDVYDSTQHALRTV